MACALGADPAFAVAAMSVLKPESNRLEIEKNDKAYTLRDAYNSNPDGFASALKVLKALPSQRRILMTPGMIELGHKQEEENRRVAEQAATVCDEVILVGQTNRPALERGLRDGGLSEEHIHTCETRDEALEVLKKLRSAEDSLLIENDLTDIYEAVERF